MITEIAFPAFVSSAENAAVTGTISAGLVFIVAVFFLLAEAILSTPRHPSARHRMKPRHRSA